MGLFDGVSAILGSPFTLVSKTVESICSTPKELSSDDLTQNFKGVTKIVIPGSSIIEGALDTVKNISDNFDK